VPAEWIEGLKDGARVEYNVAQATTDKMEAIFLQRLRTNDIDASIQAIKDRMLRRAQEWKNWHPESYESMEGQEMFDIFSNN
ncbi:MAG: hypothetical protein JXA81_07270, partial [Sedimentisphaerales bacterium]|nr:hypothetical protein [Sedimentisphaerales bacterium]